MNKQNIDYKRLFNMNTIFTHIINFAAYIILFASLCIVWYLSFVQNLNFYLSWTTLGIYAGAAGFLSWINWNNFYSKQYENVMAEDIEQANTDKYSIHARYYAAIKDWEDTKLQEKIDKFNEEYLAKWLNWVSHITGYPIETTYKTHIDENGNKIVDEKILGIKDLPYKGFKRKLLMWRIKNHKYPQSGYTTSMQLLSLFSYSDSNLNKRRLGADKLFHIEKSASKLITSLLILSVTGSVVPEMVSGNWWEAIFKLGIALFSLLSSVFAGSITGVRGARLKLSTVEDVCADLERWSDKKSEYNIQPYVNNNLKVKVDALGNKKPELMTPSEVVEEIFSKTESEKK